MNKELNKIFSNIQDAPVEVKESYNVIAKHFSSDNLVEEVNSLEQKIWNSGKERLIREWDDYSEELMNEDRADSWDDLDSFLLKQAFDYAHNLLKKYNIK